MLSGRPRRLRRAPCLTVVLVALVSPFLNAETSLPDARSRCESQLDLHLDVVRQGRLGVARTRLEALAEQCTELPHIRHALASLAARQGRWDDAIAELEAAIALDARAADSLAALRAIHRWRAAQAYASALGKRSSTRGPVPELQNSTLVNSDTRRRMASDAELRDDSVLDYELWNWWTSAADGYRDEHLNHYVADFQGEALIGDPLPELRPDWDFVDRDIEFTRDDAVALVRWQRSDAESDRTDGRLLLLRLEGDRWRIYREMPL